MDPNPENIDPEDLKVQGKGGENIAFSLPKNKILKIMFVAESVSTDLFLNQEELRNKIDDLFFKFNRNWDFFSIFPLFRKEVKVPINEKIIQKVKKLVPGIDVRVKEGIYSENYLASPFDQSKYLFSAEIKPKASFKVKLTKEHQRFFNVNVEGLEFDRIKTVKIPDELLSIVKFQTRESFSEKFFDATDSKYLKFRPEPFKELSKKLDKKHMRDMVLDSFFHRFENSKAKSILQLIVAMQNQWGHLYVSLLPFLAGLKGKTIDMKEEEIKQMFERLRHRVEHNLSFDLKTLNEKDEKSIIEGIFSALVCAGFADLSSVFTFVLDGKEDKNYIPVKFGDKQAYFSPSVIDVSVKQFKKLNLYIEREINEVESLAKERDEKKK